MKTIKSLMALAVLAVILGFAYMYSGLYPIGADVPHNGLTYWVLETTREQSIKRAAEDIEVPVLEDADRLLAGGPDYNEMCASCHLKPGKTDSDFTVGLYPKPPNLTRAHDHGDAEEHAREQFWVIKHGIKASGMPAWGPTHDDERIWNMVAFLQKLPELNEIQYQILTARSEGDDGGHNH